MTEAARRAGIPVTLNRVGSMMTAFFNAGPVTDYASSVASNTKRYAAFFHAMLSRGVYLAPSQFEAAFVSLVHEQADIEATAEAARESLEEIAK
jgi:glutamate-1-semialdehyde 2,1-aminomutase